MLFCMLTAMKAHSILRSFFPVVVIINVTISSSQKHQWNICANICSCGVIILGYDFIDVAEHYIVLYINHSWRMNCKRQPINITTRKIYSALYKNLSKIWLFQTRVACKHPNSNVLATSFYCFRSRFRGFVKIFSCWKRNMEHRKRNIHTKIK